MPEKSEQSEGSSDRLGLWTADRRTQEWRGGYDSGHGGGGGYGHSHGGYKVQPRKPGPFGYPTPNFKCEKSSETLYVTETELTYDKKCYNVYKVQCKDGRERQTMLHRCRRH